MNQLEILKRRKSIRSYTSAGIEDSVRNSLNSEATFINSHEAGLNFRIFYDDPAPFRGMTRSYGMLRGVRNYLAAIIDPTFPDTYERAGYYAEQFVIEAVKCGLGTCFVGGTFSSAHVGCMKEVYEKIPFVIAFGESDESRTPVIAKIAIGFAHRKMRTPRKFYDGDDAEYAEAMQRLPWLGRALEALACAPSTLNKQPVRLKLARLPEGGYSVEAHTVEPEKYAVELGIGKFNVAFAVGGEWMWGEKGLFYPEL